MINTKEIDTKNLEKFAIVAYDKDNDYYGYFATSDNLEELTNKLIQYKEAINKDALRREQDGEPFDWAFVEETVTQNQIVVSWEI